MLAVLAADHTVQCGGLFMTCGPPSHSVGWQVLLRYKMGHGPASEGLPEMVLCTLHL